MSIKKTAITSDITDTIYSNNDNNIYIYYKNSEASAQTGSEMYKKYMIAMNKLIENSSIYLTMKDPYIVARNLAEEDFYMLNDSQLTQFEKYGNDFGGDDTIYLMPYIYYEDSRPNILMYVCKNIKQLDGLNFANTNSVVGIYMPEEDKIYAFVSNKTSGTKGKAVYNYSQLGNKKIDGIWMEPQTEISYSVNGTEYKNIIYSGTQLKQFFKQYGEALK